MWRSDSEKPDPSFDEFMTRGQYCLNYPIYMDRSYRDIIVGYVARYEDLEAELTWIFDGLGVPFDGSLDVKLKSGYEKPDATYSELMEERYPEYIDRARRIYQKEVDLHGYTFEDCR